MKKLYFSLATLSLIFFCIFNTYAQTISTGAVSGSPFCGGASFNVSYTISGTFNTGNQFIVQASDSSGSFSNPTVLASVTSTGSGTIACTVPPTAVISKLYRVRVISTNPAVIGSDNGSNLEVKVSFSGLPAEVCSNMPIMTLYPSPSGGTFSGTGTIVGSNNYSPVSAGIGTHVVTYTDLGCTVQQTVKVVSITSVSYSGFNPTLTYCKNEAAVTLTGSPLGGVFSGPGISGNIFTPTNANIGTNNVSYTHIGCPSGASNPYTKTVTVLAAPAPGAGTDVTICKGKSTTLKATGSTNYTWNTSPVVYTDTAKVSPTATTTYIVSSTAGGCTGYDTVVVYVNDNPTANAGADVSICKGSSTTLNATGGGTYSWSPSAGLSSASLNNPTANPTITSTYILTVTKNNCTATDNIVITVNTLPTASAGVDTAACAGSPVTITATGAGNGGSYSWSPATGLSSAVIANPSATPASTTTYTVTAKDKNGCTASDNMVFTVKSVPTITGIDTAVCKGDSVKISATFTGAAPTFSLFNFYNKYNGHYYYTSKAKAGWNTALTNSSATGGHLATITDSLENVFVSGALAQEMWIGFTDQTLEGDFQWITGEPVSFGKFSGTTGIYPWWTGEPNNAGGNEDYASINYSGHTGRWNDYPATQSLIYAMELEPIKWNTGSTNDFAYVKPTVNTTYTVTITLNGCSATSSVKVTSKDLPVADAGTNVTICQGKSTTLNATGGSIYTWAASPTLSATNISNPVATPTAASTTYTVTVTAANQCKASDNVVVTMNTPTASAGSDVTICKGGSTTLTATNGTGGGSYSWSPATGLSSVTVASPSANPTVTTTYSVTATNLYGCTATSSVKVTVSTITPSAGANKTICNGDSVQLTATGGGTYSWSNGKITASIYVKPTTTTTYTVTVTSGVCTGTSSAIVTVNTLPAANAGADVTVCSGSTTTLNATGGGTYSWSPATGLSSTTINNPVSTPTATITYVVTVTGANLCTASDNVVVTLSSVTADAGANQTICKGVTATLTANGAGTGGSYTWSTTPAQYTPSISVAPTLTTTYTVTAVNKSGCSGTKTVTVNVNNVTANAGGPQTICQGDNITITGTGGGTYSWSTNQTTASINVAPTTTTEYRVTVTNNGCSATDRDTVTVQAAITANITGNNKICKGSIATFTVSGGSTYTWNTSPVQYTATINVNPTVATTYSVTTKSGTCTASNQIAVTVNNLPTANAGADVSICSGASTTLSASGGNTYSWSPATGLSSATISNPTANSTTTTTYIVTVTDANNCSATDNVVVNVKTLPTVDAGVPQTICKGTIVTLTATGTGGNTYSWNTTPAKTTASITDSPVNTTTYVVTATNNGCTASDNVVVTIQPSLNISAGADVTICNGLTTTLNATGGTTYTWGASLSLSALNISNPVANPTATTTYTVTANSGVCSGTSQVVVSVNNLPIADAGADVTICMGKTTTLNASGGTTYTWAASSSLSATNINNPVANPTATTTYTVTASSGIGCSASDNVVVTVNSLPVADAGTDQTICKGITTGLSANGGNSYSWNTGDQIASISVKPDSTTTYIVTVTNNSNCTASAQVIVNVNLIPNASAGPDQTVCNSSAVLTATGGTTYSWSTGETTKTITVKPLSTLTYYVTASTLGCSATSDVVVTFIDQIYADAGIDRIICTGGSTTLTATGGSTYSWDNGSTGSSITVSPAVTTTYIVTVGAGICSATDNVVVAISPLVLAGAGNDVTIGMGSNTILQGSGGVSYSWSPSTYLDDQNKQYPVSTPTSTITYTVTASNIHGCTGTDNVVITVDPAPAVNAGIDVNLCIGDSTTLNASYGMPGVTYSWSPATDLSATDIANPVAKPAVSTTYVVTVYSGLGVNLGTDDVAVIVHPLTTANAGSDVSICNGNGTNINATGGKYYQWSPSSGLSLSSISNPVASPVSTTTYNLTVTDDYGCSSTDDIVVNVSKAIPLNLGPGKAVCEGDSLTITSPVIGNSYLWNNYATTSSITVKPSSATDYKLTVTFANGCTASDRISIIMNQIPKVNFTLDTSFCQNSGSKILSGIPAGGVFSGTGIIVNTFNPATLGPANITYKYDSVYDNTIPIFFDDFNSDKGWTGYGKGGWERGIAKASTGCDGSSQDPAQDASPDPLNYLLGNTIGGCYSNNIDSAYYITSPVINCSGASNVHLKFNRNAGCEGNAWDHINLQVKSNKSGWVTIFTNGISNLNDTSWTLITYDLGAYADNQDSVQIRFGIGPTDSLGTYKGWNIDEVKIYGELKNTCTGKDSSKTTVYAVPTVNAGGNKTICSGDTITIKASGATSYQWSNGNNSDSIIVNPSVTTTYTVTGKSNNCNSTDMVVVTVNPLPSCNAGSNVTICDKDSTLLSVITDGVSYTWNNGITQPTQFVSPSVTSTYSVTVSSALGCKASKNIVVKVNSLPVADAGADVTICNMNSTTLSAKGGRWFQWSNGSSSSDIIVSPSTTTDYILTVIDLNNCKSTDTVKVTVNPLPLANAGADVTICDKDSTTLIATGGTVYSWSTGTTKDTLVIKPSVITTYIVTVTDVKGCSATDNVIVTVNPLPDANAGTDQTICDNAPVTYTATGGVSYIWNNGNFTATLSDNPHVTTVYTVTVTSNKGCKAVDSVKVTVNPLPVVNVSNDVIICNHNSTTLIATGGIDYSWSNGRIRDTNIVSPSVTTTYYVTVTDINKCSNTNNVIVTVTPLPVAKAGADKTICNTDSALITVSGGNFYQWSNGSIKDSLFVAPVITTKYTVTVTGLNNCSASDEVIVNVNNLPIADAGPDATICKGDSVKIYGSGGTNYLWSNSQTTAIITVKPVVTTTYGLTVTNSFGCTATDNVIVTVNNLPVISAGLNAIICNGNTTNLTASGGVSYLWNTKDTAGTITVKPNITTTYIVTGTDANGCSSKSSVVVRVDSLPVAYAGSNIEICYGNSAQINATGGIAYSWSPSTALSSTAINNPVANPTTTTTYIVTVTNAKGCTATDDIVIIVDPLPVPNAGADVSICYGSSTTLKASGGITYQWSPATGLSSSTIPNPVAAPSMTTTYILTVYSSLGCSAADTLVITVNDLPVANAGSDVSICYGNNTTLNGTGGNTYLWSPATGLSAANIASPVASPLKTTTYKLTVNDANGCTSTAAVIINVNPLPVVDAGKDVSICSGGSSNLKVTGLSFYNWSPALGLDQSNIANPVASPVNSTTYHVTVTDINACSAMDSVVVTVNNLPVVSAGSDAFICKGGSTTLKGTGGTSYVWWPALGLNNPNISNPVANPTITTAYFVTVTDANGCTGTSSMTLTVGDLPIANAGHDLTICKGKSDTLKASGGAQYKWFPANGLSTDNIANPVASPVVTSTYSLTATSIEGCTGTDQVVVNVNPIPTAFAGNDQTICTGSKVTLKANQGEAFYKWNTGVKTDSIKVNPTITSTYSLTVTNTFNCTATDNVVVEVNNLPNVSAGNDVSICNGTNAYLTASGALTYNWSPAKGLNATNIINPVASPSLTTTYYVAGTDVNGCINTAKLVVTVYQLPVADAGSAKSICAGDSVMLDGSGAGLSYQWSPVTGLSNPTFANPYAKPASTTTYSVIVTGSGFCTSSSSVVVTVNPIPVVTTSSDVTINLGQTTNLRANGGSAYQWSPATGLNDPDISNPTASPNTTTTYTVLVSDKGCSATHNVIVNVTIVANAGLDKTICNGDVTTVGTPGMSGVTYAWSPTSGLSASNIAQPQAHPSVTTTYVLTVTSAGATNTDQVVVMVNNIPAANAGVNVAICSGASAKLSATGGTKYSWSPALGLDAVDIASPTATPSDSTLYSVTVTSGYGCTSTSSVMVAINPLPVASAGTNSTICYGSNATLTATGGTIYSWSPASGLDSANIASPKASPITTTTYTVTVTDKNSCTATAGTVVNVNQYPVLNSDPFKVITNGDSVLLAASKGVSYKWSTGAVTDSIFAKPSVTTTYMVTITGNGGCSVTDQTIVYVDNIPVLQITGLDSAYCKYHSNVNIVSIPSGGALTGTGVTGNTLSVVNAGVGTHTISYAYDTTYQNIVTVFADNFSAEKGWTGYGAGGWERGPAKSGNPCNGSSDPASDHTQNGDNYIVGTRIGNCYDNNLMSTYYLTSPVINCSKVKNVSFDFWRNAGVESSISDKLTIQVYDGTSWVTVYSNPTGNMNDKNWTKVKYNVSQYADGISNFMIRFGVGPTDNLNQFKGWNIDDIEVTGMIEHTCSNQITKSYKVLDVPAASAGAGKTICFGSQATLIAKGGTSYHWNTGVTKDSLIVNPAKSTNYTVTVTDKNGCTASSTALVNVNVLPVVSAGGDKSICPKDSAILTASGASTYSWNTFTTTTSVKVSPAVKSTYTVTGTDANGCTGTGFAIVNLYTSPVAEAGKNINICIGGKTNLNATGGKFYKWSPATSLNADYISNPTANPAVTTTYKLTVSDIHSCTAVDSLIVYVNPLPNANAGKDTSMCIGNKIMLKATGGKTYIWSNGIKADTTIVSPAKSTTYSVTVTDTLGCVSNSTVKVTVNNLPNASGGANTMICTGDSATLNGSGGVKYVWNFGPATQSVKVSPVKNTTYYLTVTDINGCNSTAKVSVGVNSLPVVKVSGDTTVCAGGAVSLNANGALTYKWSNGASGASINAVTNTNTTYVVTGYDKNNCQSKDSIFVSTFTVNNPKITVTGGGLVYCEGNNISLTLTVPAKYYSYLWSSGSTTSSITVKSGGRYYARVSDKSGKCLAYSDTIVVHVKPLPVADFGRSDSALKISFFNRSQNYTSSKWYFGDGAVDSIMNPVHVYGAYGYYTVKLVAYNSCGVDSVSQSLYLRDVGIEDNEATLNNIKLYPIPTSDNVTLQFTTSKVDNMEVTIFDQLGAEIYKEQIGSFQGQFTKTYNLNKFAKGVYLFQIRSDKGIVNRRAIVE